MQALGSKLASLLLWLAAFAAVAAIIGWETGWGGRILPAPGPGPAPKPQPVALALLPDYAIEGVVAGSRETVERPAFVPTRRPAPAPVQEVPKPRMARNQFTLTGTAVVDQKQIAFLREIQGGKARTVRAGETINGVTVTEIKPDRVKLSMGDETEELVLKVASGPRQTIQPPAVAAAPPPGTAPVPGAPAVGGQPIAADAGAPMDADAQILARRRAARAAAAQAAQEAAARAAGQQPVPGAPPAPGAIAAPQPAQAVAPASAPDPAWADVYRRMQQPRR
jgi:hypothetical protein